VTPRRKARVARAVCSGSLGLSLLGLSDPANAQASGVRPCLTRPLAEFSARTLAGTDDTAKLLEQLLPIAPDLRGGAVQDLAVRRALQQGCTGTDAARWLGHVCSLPDEGDALESLRAALVLDAVNLSARAQDRALPAEARTRLELAVAVLEALLLDPTPRGLALRLLRAGKQVAVCEANNAAPAQLTLSPGVPPEVAQMALLIWRLQERLEELKANASLARQAADEALARLGARALNDEQAQALQLLVERLVQLEQVRANPAARWAALLGVLQSASLTVSLPSPNQEMQAHLLRLQALGLAIAEANTASFQSLTLQQLDAVSPAAATAARAAFEMLAARDGRALDSVTGVILGQLGPWAANVIFDVNIGAARLSSTRDFSFAGDLTLGYAGKAFGVVGRGFLSAYDLTTDTSLSQTERGGGSADLFWVSNPGPARLEVRLSGGGYLYNTDSSTPMLALAEEQNLMGRGSLSAGLRLEPSPKLGFGVWVGGGAQVDVFDGVTVDNAGTVMNASENAVSALLEARLRFQVVVVPRWLVFRARGDFQRFSFSRDANLLTITGEGPVVAPGTVSESSQTELGLRGFFDAEAARFAGFVPSIGGGLDYINQASQDSDFALTVPVFHAGLRRVIY
jgi:hypothetical protein